MAASSLRNDVLDVLEMRQDACLLSVLRRHGQVASYTGRELFEEARAVQAFWDEYLGPGPKVLIAALPAGETFIFPLLASLLGGGSLVPVALPRPSDPPGRLGRMARICAADAVLCTLRNRAAVEAQLRDDDGALACPVLVVDAPEPVTARVASNEGRLYPIIQHTSGSTRFPKAVPLTAAQIRANCGLIQTLWGMSSSSVMVNWLPHYHDMGLMGCILYPLLSGARSIQMSPFDMIRRPLSWLEAISAYRGTISGGPAFAFQECLARIAPGEGEDLDLHSWECAFCGAEPVPAGLLDRFHARFSDNGLARASVFSCYGMAECTLFAAGEPGEEGGSPDVPPAWRAVDGSLLSERTRHDIRIVDPGTGAELPEGVPGEIWLSGASIGDGYLGEPLESGETFHVDIGGRRWLRTGDLGGIAGQHLYITGRSKDIVIVNGRNVAAAEIEWIAAQEHPALNPSAAASFAYEGATAGHAALYIEVRPGAVVPDDPARVVARIRRSVTGGCGVVLDEVCIVPRGSLPRTSSGKIRRRHIAASYAPGGLALLEEVIR